jgi:hypothetical protein
MSAFGGSMKHIKLVDCHRKDIAMAEQSGTLSQEKQPKVWKDDVDTRNRWAYGALTIASFLTLQTFLPVGLKDVALIVSFLAFAVSLPLNVLLVLLTYTNKKPNFRVRIIVGGIAVAGSFIGIDAAFWHISWVVGIVFSVVSVIAFVVAWQYIFGFRWPKTYSG